MKSKVYSPIKKIYIRNFRNLGDVELDFSLSPIITLVGDNEAGKTSVIKAITTCGLNANPREQKDYIRDNTKMFGVAIELEDGTTVTRIKELSGINSYQITKDKQLLWKVNKITDGLPEEVQKVMGLIAEPETNEFLHIRTYEDKLLFVVTPNSTNYKVMYNALKVEQVAKAIKAGSAEVNELKSKNNNNEISKNALEAQLKSIHTFDIEPLLDIRDRLKSQLNVINKVNKAKTLLDKIKQSEAKLGALLLLDKFGLKEIDELLVNRINNASRLLEKRNKAEELAITVNNINSLGIIEVDNLEKMTNILTKKNILQQKISDASVLNSINEISEISELNVMQLNKVKDLLNEVETYNQKDSLMSITDYESIDTSVISKIIRAKTIISENNTRGTTLTQINNYIEQVHNYMKQCGVAVETCPKCGEAVVFDIDKLE